MSLFAVSIFVGQIFSVPTKSAHKKRKNMENVKNKKMRDWKPQHVVFKTTLKD
jgi:hypothetical protein